MCLQLRRCLEARGVIWFLTSILCVFPLRPLLQKRVNRLPACSLELEVTFALAYFTISLNNSRGKLMLLHGSTEKCHRLRVADCFRELRTMADVDASYIIDARLLKNQEQTDLGAA
jgi:hypothetical protein